MDPDYFDDDALRDREPVLFHEYIGMSLLRRTVPYITSYGMQN